jgi:hypothetical protein
LLLRFGFYFSFTFLLRSSAVNLEDESLLTVRHGRVVGGNGESKKQFARSPESWTRRVLAM